MGAMLFRNQELRAHRLSRECRRFFREKFICLRPRNPNTRGERTRPAVCPSGYRVGFVNNDRYPQEPRRKNSGNARISALAYDDIGIEKIEVNHRLTHPEKELEWINKIEERKIEPRFSRKNTFENNAVVKERLFVIGLYGHVVQFRMKKVVFVRNGVDFFGDSDERVEMSRCPAAGKNDFHKNQKRIMN